MVVLGPQKYHLELLDFWTLSIVPHSKKLVEHIISETGGRGLVIEASSF
jgi:hypothetical protein